ncbi:MAG: hypothetical protein HY378_00385 [Candidatus Brennerbacteria bacterium]|nr:hypothetical protein [Candidatus Brennerbacteria bacterium]
MIPVKENIKDRRAFSRRKSDNVGGKKGKLIVIEGTDGSGKFEQVKKLTKRLHGLGMKYKVLDFPRYGRGSAYFLEKYLRGEYGGLGEVTPEQASIFYALDRFDDRRELKNWLKRGHLVLSNRYVASNMAHQGAKISSRKERVKFLNWLDNLEYGILGIPRPDLNLVLYVPAKIGQKLVDKKGKSSRKYLGGKRRDLHEKNLKYLNKTQKVYLDLVRIFPKQFRLINCMEKERLLSIGEVHDKVWREVRRFVKA